MAAMAGLCGCLSLEKSHIMKPIIHFTTFASPLGAITLAATERGLCGVYNDRQKHWPSSSDNWMRDDGPRFDLTREWLANYFAGKMNLPLPPLDFVTGTEFQQKVWRALQRIPKGSTVTYGQLAAQIHAPKAVRAVGAAVGRNPISILIPCHRVIGSQGSLTGYAGGLERKLWLLEHEGINML